MERLSWQEITSRYFNEWVYLIDYDWAEDEPYPISGVVQIHAKTRHDFNALMLKGPPISGARLFVGPIKKTDSLIMLGNHMRISCE